MSMPPNPYVGPRAFKQDDRWRFHGREREIGDVLDLVIAERIVLLHSPSGAGKTSLIQAALIPELIKEAFTVLPIMRVNTVLPPELEVRSANRFIHSALLDLETALPPAQRRDTAKLAALEFGAYLDARRAGTRAENAEVLIFDQFEEILTVDPHSREGLAARNAFFAQVGTALRDRRRWAVFSVRDDYVAGLEPYLDALPTRLGNRFRLDLLQVPAAMRAIQQPANAQKAPDGTGVGFSDAAARWLAGSLSRIHVRRGETGAEEEGRFVEPVQLQVVCYRLWERLPWQDLPIREERRWIEEAHVTTHARIDDALGDYYDEKIATIVKDTGITEAALREWIDEYLTTARGTRSQLRPGSERDRMMPEAVIRALVNAYLVRQDERHGTIWLELAHDRLVAPVRQSNEVYRRDHSTPLQRQAKQWADENRPPRLLMRDTALVVAQDWADTHLSDLSSSERERIGAFLQASHDVRHTKELATAREAAEHAESLHRVEQKRADDQVKASRRLRLMLIAAVAAAVIALLAAGFGKLQERLANASRAQAEAFAQVSLGQALAAQSLFANSALESGLGSGGRGQLLARQAYLFASAGQGTAPAAIDAALRQALTFPWLSDVFQVDGPVSSVAFSPNGRTLATGSSGAESGQGVRLWNLEDPDSLMPGPEDQMGRVNAVAFSPDGQTLAAAGHDGRVRLWDLARLTATPVSLPPEPEPAATVLGIAFSPDGARLATASLDGTRIWNLEQPEAPPLLLAIQPDEVAESFFGSAARAVAFSPDGQTVAAASLSASVLLWNLGQPAAAPTEFSTEPRTPQTESVTPQAVAFSPEGETLVAGASDGSVLFWRVTQPDVAPDVRRSRAGTNRSPAVLAVAFAPSGRLLATGNADGRIDLWDASTRQRRDVSHVQHDGRVTSLAFSPDGGRLVTGGEDGLARVWSGVGEQGAAPLVLTPPGNAALWSTVFSADGSELAAGADNGVVWVWDAHHLETAPVELRGHGDRVLAVVFSRDQEVLVSGGADRSIRIWDWRDPAASPRLLADHEDWVTGLAFSPDGQTLASSSFDNSARLWNLDQPSSEPTVLSAEAGGFTDVAFSPDGRLLAASGRNSTIWLWNLQDRDSAPTILRGSGNAFTSLAFRPDGGQLASGSNDNSVWLWNLDRMADAPIVLSGTTDIIYSVSFNAVGSLLASSGRDRGVRLWNPRLLSEAPIVLPGHTDWVTMLTFNPEDGRLASASEDGTLRLWITSTATLADMVCQQVQRNLTPAEWDELVGASIPYQSTCPNLPPGAGLVSMAAPATPRAGIAATRAR